MSKNLYFVDSIYSPIEMSFSIVTLLSTDPGGQETRTVRVENDELGMSDHAGKIREGWFVYCDSENHFSYGNRSAYARTQFSEYKRLLGLTVRDYISEESNDESVLFDLLSRDDHVCVTSYHVNVAHGNCSLILLRYEGGYQIWMVDCSLSEKGNGTPFAVNLEAAFSAIKTKLGMQEGESLHINRFFLTHAHIDHYSGVEYLVNKGYIDHHTLCYWNIYYHMAGAKYLNVWNTLLNAKVKFIEPISRNSQRAFRFLHPECRIYRSKGTAGNKNIPSRTVGSVNNSSAVIKFVLGRKSMVFPGDLEQRGFKTMSGNPPCRNQLKGIDYYAVSHHGSLNGHPIVPCLSPGAPCPSPLCCISERLQKAVLMGRDSAYPGIYSPLVTNYWSGLRGGLVYTERVGQYYELEW